MRAYFERGEHLPLLLAVDEAVVVLHGDKRRQVVVDRVVYVTTLNARYGLSNWM